MVSSITSPLTPSMLSRTKKGEYDGVEVMQQQVRSDKDKDTTPNYYWTPSTCAVDVVVFPSMTQDCPEDFKRFPGLGHYEERHLFGVFLLQHSQSRVFYFSSYPLDPAIVQYYTSLLPPCADNNINNKIEFDASSSPMQTTDFFDEDENGAQSRLCSITELIPGRLYNVCAHNDDDGPLADKVAQKYDLVHTIKPMLRPHAQSYLLCYRTTEVEEKMAQDLGIFLYGSAPSLDVWGSKSGSRSIFKDAGVPHALGIPLTHDVRELAEGLRGMMQEKMTENANKMMDKVVVKLDQFSAGGGNALLDLSTLSMKDGEIPSVDAIMSHLDHMETPFESTSCDEFKHQIEEYGAIVEEWLDGEGYCAPSCQGVISESGDVAIISTHEQLLQGQQYIGCKFPAAKGYRVRLSEMALRVGKVMSGKGMRGHFGVDFVVRRKANGEWDVNAIEINLRYTGTTGPYMTMAMLMGGRYDFKSGLYYSREGQAKYYAETDGLHHASLVGLSPSDFVSIINADTSLQLDTTSQTGPVFHMLGALSKYGKVGVTCLADTEEAAKDMLLEMESRVVNAAKIYKENKNN